MSDRICYLERTDRGLALSGIRLVGAHADDHWDATAGGSPDAVLQTIEDAAVWIRQRLKSSGGGSGGASKSFPILCLDTDGTICTWTKPEDNSPEVIAAAIDQLDIGQDDDTLEGAIHSSMGERFPNLPLEVNYEPLSDEQTSDGSRQAVVATPDISARLLIDQLDSMGIRIGRVENIWSLIAMGWDPGAPHRSSTRDSQRVVSTDDPVCGCVVMDPGRARLIWTWSKRGQLIAAGSMRIGHDSSGPVLHESDLSRLCADWLGWAAQLGVAPMRVVMVLPENDSESRPESRPGKNQESGSENGPKNGPESDPESGSESERRFDHAKIGSMFSSHWPMATTDLITEPDPILATLRAVHSLEDSALGTHAGTGKLTNRPGRSHRSMYRWAGAALILAGTAVGWTATVLYAQGSDTASQAKSVRAQMTDQIMKLQPPVTDLRLPTAELQARLSLLVSRTGPMQVTAPKPVLEELETVSFVLGMSGIDIDSISLSNTLATLKIRTQDLALAEQINEALRSIEGSHIQWRASPDLTNRGAQIEATFTGTWIRQKNSS
ncbi:MAG: hypothetical protein JKY43_04215 [Phycisphaerales bacterium]|nr:hypothetical protein [Phycisphaerales bacterium]